ncbi:MAG: glycogen debranching protein, partial [Verrucomicrobiae bacterium]|nr:glycogen debranching protein [Verrucomicrobiae bacterium]
VYVVATTEPDETINAAELMERERERRRQFHDRDAVRAALCAAADAFLVQRRDHGLSIVAGFPWHGESGRSAMIALPGLLLNTRRYEEARRVLVTFAAHCNRGLIPNLLPLSGGQAAYNSVDASLWFVVAAWKYWKTSRNKAAMAELLPTLREILRWYRDGTHHGIGAADDGLIVAGGAGSQLTWMDVKIEGYVPTPRHGKPVEINALWFNALLMLAEVEEAVGGNPQAAEQLRTQAGHVAASFLKTFWNSDGGYLFDVVQDGFRDPSIRPNQIFAVGLPFSPLSAEQQTSVLKVVTEQLLTPYGLRTLSPNHEKYAPHYRGTRWQRDAIRHQGTVWPFLIGAYADAFLRVHGSGENQRQRLRELIGPLLEHLEQAGLGSVSEMFDAEPPHCPAGCPAHACGVAELLRAYELCRG